MKKTGKQTLLCKDCHLQFQAEYKNKGADKAVKEKLIRMLVRGSGVGDCQAALQVSLACVLSTMLQQGAGLEIRPKHRHYERVQFDEQWSYVKEKKKKVWMIYALCTHTGEILAASWGKRNKAGVSCC